MRTEKFLMVIKNNKKRLTISCYNVTYLSVGNECIVHSILFYFMSLYNVWYLKEYMDIDYIIFRT